MEFNGPVTIHGDLVEQKTVNVYGDYHGSPDTTMAELAMNDSSRETKICSAIDTLYGEELVRCKYYLAAIRKILLEQGIYDKLGYKAFAEMLHKGCNTFKDDLPSEDSINKVIFLGTFPNWEIRDKQPADCINIKIMVERFLELMK